MQEKWKDIEGYEGLYQVSNLGRVRSLDMFVNHWRGGKRLVKGRTLQPSKDKLGYKRVTLVPDRKNHFVHRLVAKAFIPNPDNLPIINHKNCTPGDDRVENLEWCTVAYNNMYADANIKRSENQKGKVIPNDVRKKISDKLKGPNHPNWGKHLSEETKRNISNSRKDKRTVYQYTLDNKLVNIFNSLSDASRETETYLSNICKCCKGVLKNTNGYKWSYNPL